MEDVKVKTLKMPKLFSLGMGHWEIVGIVALLKRKWCTDFEIPIQTLLLAFPKEGYKSSQYLKW